VPTAGTYIRIDRGVAGVRLSGTRRLGPTRTSPRLTAGVDLQRLGDGREELRSEGGRPTDSVLVNQQETVTEIGPFAQMLWTPNERLLLSAGGRYDRVTFDAEDRHFTDGADNSGNRTLDAFSGSLGASYLVTPAFIPYANIGTSFETPTTNELGNRPDGQGGFNDDLGPQRAVSFELGARGDPVPWVSYSVAAFTNRVTDAIVQFAAVDAAAFFTNAGRIDSRGLELGLSLKPFRRLSFFGSYTFADYTFDEYLTPQGDEVSGNRVPGVPRHFTRIGLRSEPAKDFALDVDHTLSSSLPADDLNQLFIGNWGAGVTNARVSWSGQIGVGSLSPFIGVNNVWDRDYISSVTINGVGGRVIEPAPGRVVYVGVEIGYLANP
jgi:iron complex outermembrane recepter protein